MSQAHVARRASPPIIGDATYTAPVSFFQLTMPSSLTLPAGFDGTVFSYVNPGDAITITHDSTDYTAGIIATDQITGGGTQGQWMIILSSTPG